MMTATLLILFVVKRYECIQVSTMPDFLVFTTIIPKIFGAKVLLDLHEPTPELWVTKHGVNRLRWLLFLQIRMEQLAIQYADHCLTVTEALRHRFGERGADIQKITVIPNVCEEETFCDDSSFEENASGRGFRLITHGLIEERYGHEVVIRAVDNLRERLPNLQFDIIGDGEYKSSVARIIQELGCENQVHLLGFVPVEELLQRLRETDAGVIAMKRSPYSELVDTNKMYEYIALRKPIIISRLPGVEENFDDSCLMFFKDGNVEDLSKCIVELYHDQLKRRTLAENAYRRYEKIRWRETKKAYLKVIEDLVA
jgi:glycosyltransferase involved in cell wall biosynthesis